MNPNSDWQGQVLTAASQEQPSLTLEFYTYGVMLHKRNGDAVVECPVDPSQIAPAWQLVSMQPWD